MLQKLTDNRSTLFLLLGIAAIVLGMIWVRTRDRRCLYGLGGVGAVALVLLLLALFGPESDSAQIKRKVNEMAEGVKAKDVDRIFQHISEQFRYRSTDKQEFRQYADAALRRGEVAELRLSNIDKVEFLPAKAGEPATASIRFLAKPIAPGGDFDRIFRVEAIFIRDPDGQWRLKDFLLRNPINNEPLVLPELSP
ncbi:MAG: nuclear transport factor 2 family protein [Gemmataceae bacterium]|nr:nuclear transport factor 2 family protein [Gemmataceae bacterium]